MSRLPTQIGTVSLVGAILVLVVTGWAAAAPNPVITLSVGDGLAITGSKIQCGVAADSGYGIDLRGKTYIACGPSTAVKGGGYVAVMDSGGRVVILSIKTHKTVSSRGPTAVVRRAALKTARLGDRVTVTGTSLVCDVIKVSNRPTLLCVSHNAKHLIRPNSYSFGISDGEVTSLRWDGKRQVHLLQSWSEQ